MQTMNYSVCGHPFDNVLAGDGCVMFSRGKEFHLQVSGYPGDDGVNGGRAQAMVYAPNDAEVYTSIPIPASHRGEGWHKYSERCEYLFEVHRTMPSFDQHGTDHPRTLGGNHINRMGYAKQMTLLFPVGGASHIVQKPLTAFGTKRLAVSRHDDMVMHMLHTPSTSAVWFDGRLAISGNAEQETVKLSVDRKRSNVVLRVARAGVAEARAMNACGFGHEHVLQVVAQRWVEEKIDTSNLRSLASDAAIHLLCMAGAMDIGGAPDVGTSLLRGLSALAEAKAITLGAPVYGYGGVGRSLALDVLFKRGVLRDELGMHELLYDGTF